VVTDTAIVPDGGSIANTAFGTADQGPFSSNTDRLPVRYRFDLMLSVDDGLTRATEGAVLTYTIRITNVTSVPITPTGIAIYDYLEPGQPTSQLGVLHCAAPCAGWAFDSVSSDGSQVYSRTIPFLGPNQSAVVTLAAQISPTLLSDAPSVLSVANKAYATDDGRHGLEINPLNQVAEDIDIVSGSDIVVKALRAVSSAISPGQSAQFVVTLFNDGFVTTTNGLDGANWFGIDLYVKPVESPPPTSPADRFLGYCLDAPNDPCTAQASHYTWALNGLAANATLPITFTTSITPAGTYWLYVQADTYWAGDMGSSYTAGTPAHGRIVEGNEQNNIFGPLIIQVGGGNANTNIYLPLITRGLRKIYLPLLRK
jgi:hypothetical protein